MPGIVVIRLLRLWLSGMVAICERLERVYPDRLRRDAAHKAAWMRPISLSVCRSRCSVATELLCTSTAG